MIKYPKRFKEANTANNDGLFDWDFLKPAFAPTKIEPMDIDGVVERHNRFLVFETKDDGVALQEGQKILFEQLMRDGRHTIFFLNGKSPETITALVEWHWIKNKIKILEYPGIDSTFVMNRTAQWFNWANKK